MSSVKSTQLTVTTLARLKRRLQRAGIAQGHVAVAAHVSKHMVCHVLAGRATSQNVVMTAKRLLAEAKAANGGAA